ncbi:hypothetical protein EDF62_1549 [Leucobacter luti]|uniref:Uncharacterized protein n=1 Tax=Leucobacter luti TaxID=340320 RepID=A0A4R6RZF8_9MICO|nr:hypothetical protein EDF62_1549 [Leucobacter luti]
MTAPDVLRPTQSEPNYNRICAECAYGYVCSQPYESVDGTVYWCKRVIPTTNHNVNLVEQ